MIIGVLNNGLVLLNVSPFWQQVAYALEGGNGGIIANKFVMQFLADLLQEQAMNIDFPDISALGAAYFSRVKIWRF